LLKKIQRIREFAEENPADSRIRGFAEEKSSGFADSLKKIQRIRG
jgi:hypothetical protein